MTDEGKTKEQIVRDAQNSLAINQDMKNSQKLMFRNRAEKRKFCKANKIPMKFLSKMTKEESEEFSKDYHNGRKTF